jgi:hypothetical protein
VGGVLGGSKTYFTVCPAGVTAEMDGLFVAYSRPIPASALNTPITVAASSPGAGNASFAVTAHGFQRTLGAAAAAAAGTVSQSVPGGGVLAKGGVFMRMIAGSVTGALWVRI